jgi:hypothetical protein
MDEVIWVEVLSRQRTVVSRQRCAGNPIRIGRAYSNDVILDDPHVAPEHVSIAHDDEGGFIAHDLGSANGIYAEHGHRRLDRIALGDDTQFRIGNTWLRVRTGGHAVAPERAFDRDGRSWPLVLALAGAVLGIEGTVLWLTDYSEPKAVAYVVPLLGLGFAIAIWSVTWAMLSRIVAGQARIAVNLRITLLGALALEAWYVLSDLGAFGFASNALVTYRYIGFWCIIAGLAVIEMRLISPTRTALKGGLVAAVVLSGIAVQTLLQFGTWPRLNQGYVRLLMPPALRFLPAANEASFFTAVEKLQGELDKDRADEP